jgi:NTE family protein
MPEDLKNSPEFTLPKPASTHKAYSLVELVYRSQRYEGDSKDYGFSRQSMKEHWRVWYHDTVRPAPSGVLERPKSLEGVFTCDLAYDGRE